MLRSVGMLRDAIAFLSVAVVRNPDNAEIRFQLGLVYLLAEENALAQEQLLLGLLVNPEHGGIHFNLGTILQDQQDYLGAETEYRAAIRLLEAPAPAHARLGSTLLELGDRVGAEEELRRVRDLAPGSDADGYLSSLLFRAP